jgi:DNA-binding response OmpR family regulator
VEDRVRGLDAGADDYLVKPFAVEELVARVNAVLRRPGAALGLMLRCGALEFDTTNRAVSVSGETVTVPRRELQVLETLMRRAGRVVTRDALETAIYSGEDEIESNATEVTLSRLRRRLSDAGAGVVIHTVRGVGWLLKEAQ